MTYSDHSEEISAVMQVAGRDVVSGIETGKKIHDTLVHAEHNTLGKQRKSFRTK